jgi:hypothetical protein
VTEHLAGGTVLAAEEAPAHEESPLTTGSGQALLIRHWKTAAAIGWFLLIGLAVLAPALAGGTKLGPFDLLAFFGLGHPQVPIHNNVDSDLIQVLIPWTDLAATQVHHGYLPLWNQYSGAGLPLALNGQSSTFAPPTLLGYLAPVRFTYDVSLIVKLVLAGSGTFAFCRVLGLRVTAALFAGTVFELSGGFSGWLGWAEGDVFAFLGFVLAAAVLVIRDPKRPRNLVFLAFAIACAVYGGHPESILVTLIVFAVFCLCLLGWSRWGAVEDSDKSVDRTELWWPLAGLGGGLLAGLLLSAPLLLPLAQLVRGSAKSSAGGYETLPVHDSLALAFQGFDGFPTNVGHYFGASNYYDVACYVGVTALVLSVAALVRCWRRPEVVALAVVGVGCFAVVYLSPVAHVINHMGEASVVLWYRALIPLDFVLAVLAGIGLQRIMEARQDIDRPTLRVFFWTWIAAAAVVLALFIQFLVTKDSLPAGGAHQRFWSFAWPFVEVVSGVAIAWWLWRGKPSAAAPSSAARLAAGVLLLIETGFLLWAGAPLWSSTSTSFAATPGERSLQHLVGDARVGFGTCPSIDQFPDLGILPEANIGYAVSEFGFYDPIAPKGYYASWSAVLHKPVQIPATGVFCPAITSVRQAQLYGISYVLEPPGASGPRGTRLVGQPGGEGIYRVPQVSLASVSRSDGAGDVALAVHQVDPTTWRIVVNTTHAGTVHLRFTNVPGWRADLDGTSVPLASWEDAMLQTYVPPGHHVLTLQYDPSAFKAGLVLASCTVVVLFGLLVAAPIGTRIRRRAPSK